MSATLAVSAAGLVAAGGYAWGTYHRNSALFGDVVTTLGTNDQLVALTFDDGPSPRATEAVLRALGDADVAATFFVLGRHAERWPELVRQVARAGHVVGNHGYHHRKLSWAGPARARDDLARGTGAIEDATGARPHWFRAPHGFRSPFVHGAARALSQRVVGWSLGVWDSARPGEREIVRRVLAGVRPGSIVLLHDGDGADSDGDRTQTARAIPAIVDGLRERGYRLVALGAGSVAPRAAAPEVSIPA